MPKAEKFKEEIQKSIFLHVHVYTHECTCVHICICMYNMCMLEAYNYITLIAVSCMKPLIY